MTGSIYDLGYRGYDGPRLGRRHAAATLVRHSTRSVFGIGRTMRAKIIPGVCIGLPALVALILVGIRAIAARSGVGEIPVIPGHDALYPLNWVFPLLFVAAQAPELLGRDLRYRVLTLYFSRALRRPDYAIAKLAALTIGVTVILLLPQLLLSGGMVLQDADVGAALRTEAGAMPAIVGSSVSIAFVASAFALVIASLTPRRAYATAAIFGAWIIPGILSAIVIGLDLGEAAHWVVLLDIGSLLDGLNAWFFGVAPSAPALIGSDLSVDVVAATAILVGIGATIVLVWRYLRIQA